MITVVLFSNTSSNKIFINFFLSIASNPDVGSSKIKYFALIESAIISESLIFIPLDN